MSSQITAAPLFVADAASFLPHLGDRTSERVARFCARTGGVRDARVDEEHLLGAVDIEAAVEQRDRRARGAARVGDRRLLEERDGLLR